MLSKEQEAVLTDMRHMTQVLRNTGYFELVERYEQWILLRTNLFRVKNAKGITLDMMRKAVDELKEAHDPEPHTTFIHLSEKDIEMMGLKRWMEQ